MPHHADRRAILRLRARTLRAVRGWFDAQGFIEADVGALAPTPGAEVHVQGLATAAGWLHASPEFAMKKLLAAGEEKIFFLGKVYRAGETGPLHAPEFTMLEWYRAGADWREVASDALALLALAAREAGAARIAWRGRPCDPEAAAQWLSVADAFAQVGAPGLLDAVGDRDAMAALARGAGATPTPDDDWSDLFAKIMPLAEIGLGSPAPTILHDYPAPEAALARRSRQDPRVAERFELYACGVELANGFGELTDPVEQRARLKEAMAEKARRYGAAWPIDEDFLVALSAMPEAAGCAMGFDRLVLLAAGAPSLSHVLWTDAP